jgi:2-polyprenyl-3-methyl-5-hydroxy-6-metoxy-1,4-benzoquinol methylase
MTELRLKNVSVARPRTAAWTEEAMSRFWEYLSRRRDLHNEYFSSQVGAGIFNFLASTGIVTADTSVLDFGCGPGFLLEHFLAQGLRCYGIDSSPEIVRAVNSKFQHRPNWGGASVVSDPEATEAYGQFGLVTCIETIEHLPVGELENVLQQIKRLLTPTGIALFTTPHLEDLATGQIYCPFCEAEYHRMQHIRSFSPTGLRSLLEDQGFRVALCASLDFRRFQPRPLNWKDLSPRLVWHGMRAFNRRLHDKVRPRALPHGPEFQVRIEPGPHLCALAGHTGSVTP